MGDFGDFSVKKMFLEADPVVQAVMVLLVLASFSSWAVILEKTAFLGWLARQMRTFKNYASEAGASVSPADFPPVARAMVEAGLSESRDLAGGESRSDFCQRLERAMRESFLPLLDRAESHVSILATIGSTSPFVGLFGTVWGIMHSFIGIATTGETTLSVVAPGIAEALSATAVGLVAAIPAVVAYNKINSSVRSIGKNAAVGIGRLGARLTRTRFEGSPEHVPEPDSTAPRQAGPAPGAAEKLVLPAPGAPEKRVLPVPLAAGSAGLRSGNK
ncbi:MAG: MotA/TolQ/ExbB proton channel family protein [Deltaproteobacteria bacterium]|jgi:biopolymer transport protein ExbB/TolQ|nr:MotA/TolQ/ExbB proton channel family protein [Deltaproteobacteria bacterium]